MHVRVHNAIRLVGDREPTYYPLLQELQFLESDKLPTMGTNGKIAWYNHAFVDKLTLDETAGVILHEVLHCVYGHVMRQGDRHQMKWNIACDYVINPVVLESFSLPDGVLIDPKYYNKSAEEVYMLLPDPPEQPSDSEASDGSGGGDSNSQQPWGDHSMWGKNEDGSEMSKAEKASLEKKWEQVARKVLGKKYGTISQQSRRQIEDIVYMPSVPWTDIMSRLASQSDMDYSFEHPDRRFIGMEMILPGMYSEDFLKDLVFAFDTSASVSDELMTRYYMETIKLFQTYHAFEGWVSSCDNRLQSFCEITTQAEFVDFKFKGGGGTDFCPVFNEIESRNLRPKALFYFTDLEGVFPIIEPEYPVFWITGSRIDVPFGEKIMVHELED